MFQEEPSLLASWACDVPAMTTANVNAKAAAAAVLTATARRNGYTVTFHNLTRFSDPRSTQPARRLLPRRFSGLGLNIEITCCGFGAVYE